MSNPTTPSRLLALDAMRFIAVCAIVWIHATETLRSTTLHARWAVPFFTIASIWLVGESLARNPQQTWPAYAWRRTKRLYGTFLIWNIIYLFAIALKHTVFHTGKQIIWVPDLLWGGAAEHLWFLPFLWIATIAAFPICWLATRWFACAVMVGCIASGAAYYFGQEVFPMSTPFKPGTAIFLYNVWMTLSAFFVGLILMATTALLRRDFRAGTLPPILLRAWPLIAGMSGVLIFAWAIRELSRHGRHADLEAIAGAGAMLIALTPARSAFVRVLANLGRYAFGIYIVHVLWIELLQAVLTRARVAPSGAIDGLVTVAAIGLSLGLCRLLKNTPLLPE